MRVLAISGSLRKDSTNTAALDALARLAPETMRVLVYQDLARLPPFNPDDDADDAPPEHSAAMNTIAERSLEVYRRTVFKALDLPHGVEERRYPPEAAVRLYDATVVSISGYVDSTKPTDVPPHHKSSVVLEVVSAIGDLDPDKPEYVQYLEKYH